MIQIQPGLYFQRRKVQALDLEHIDLSFSTLTCKMVEFSTAMTLNL